MATAQHDRQSSEDEHLSAPSSDTDPLMSNSDQHLRDEARRGDNPTLYVALTSALVLFISTCATILSSNPKALSWFAFHPTLNTLAVLCFTFGILTLQPTSQPKTKAAGLQRHQIAMLTGLTSILLGTTAILTYKGLHGAPHFTSWHGTFGLISVCWLVLQSALGAGSVWFDGAAFGGGHKAKLVWKYHRLSGYILLLCLLVTVNLGGAWSSWASANSAYLVRLVAYNLAPLGILVSVYSRVRPSKMKFF